MNQEPTPQVVKIEIPGVPRELADRMTEIARRSHRTRAAEIRHMLEQRVAADADEDIAA